MDHGAEELESVQLSVPTVVLGDHPVGGAAVHVSTDQRAAAALATEHLLLTGRRRIAVIGARSADSRGSAALRFDGYRTVLERAGIPVEPDLIAEADPWIQVNGATAMRELLQAVPSSMQCSLSTTASRLARCVHSTTPACTCPVTSP